MENKSEMIKARDEFIALVKAELLGPGSEVSVPDAEHELITTVPEKRYSTGILFPKENKMQADGNDVDRAVPEDHRSGRNGSDCSSDAGASSNRYPLRRRKIQCAHLSPVRLYAGIGAAAWGAGGLFQFQP